MKKREKIDNSQVNGEKNLSRASRKNKKLKIFLIILLSIILCLGGLAFAFRAEISLLYQASKLSQDDITQKKADNADKTKDLLGDISSFDMRDLTDEERKKLASGELSIEDALALIKGEKSEGDVDIDVDVTTENIVTDKPEQTDDRPAVTTAEKKPAVTAEKKPAVTTDKKPAVTTTATDKNDTVDIEKALARKDEIIAEIYLLRALYLNSLDDLVKSSKDEYMNLPKPEHTLTNKVRIAEATLAKGTSLEKECDEKMYALLDELEEILISIDYSTDIIDEIEKTYIEQKGLEKMEIYNTYIIYIS